MCFKLNPYDKCVANKMINGKQCTIALWVGDNCLTHLSAKVLNRIIERSEAKFGKMTVTGGDDHIFLGMQIRMREYIEEAIEDFNQSLTRSAAIPAMKGLFDIDDKSKPL